MFGDKKLMHDGAKVLGRVTESGSDVSFTTGGEGYHVKARLEFDDGTTSETSCKVHRGLGAYGVGEVLPSEGLLGADVMTEYGSVVFDYAGGRFLLGAN